MEGPAEAADTATAKIIGLADYGAGIANLDAAFADVKDKLLGIVVNKVPQSRLAQVCDEITGKTKLPVLAVLPESRALAAISVGIHKQVPILEQKTIAEELL